MTYPDGWRMDYSYDALGRVTQAIDDNGRTLVTLAYDALSRRQTLNYANGTTAHYGYTPRGDLSCQDWNLTGTTPASCNSGSSEIAYDYNYNGARQVLSESISDSAFAWAPPINSVKTYQANGLNQYVQIGTTTPSYDDNGNLTSGPQGQNYSYDAENLLRSASNLPGGTSASYRYYADGSRRAKTLSGSTTDFYYMGRLGDLTDTAPEFAANQEIAEYQGSSLQRRSIRLPGSIDEALLVIDFTVSSSCTNASYALCERWAHTNRQGSLVAVTDAIGAVIEKHSYSPYGESEASGSGGTNEFPFRYTGQRFDPETGLYYYKARYYDPRLGRFLQTDPIGYEDQMNLYAYVGNDPVNLTDPTGECISGTCRFGEFSHPTSVAQAKANGEAAGKAALIGSTFIGDGGVGLTVGRQTTKSIVSNLSNASKGKIGETLSRIGSALRGEKKIAAQKRAGDIPALGNVTGRATRSVPDLVVRTKDGTIKVREAKFGTSGLTGAQRELKRQLGDGFSVVRTTADDIANAGGAAGAAAGATTGGAVGGAAGAASSSNSDNGMSSGKVQICSGMGAQKGGC